MKRLLFYITACLLLAGAYAKPYPARKPSITKIPYGEVDGKQIFQYTLTNSNGMQLKVINYGATITDIVTPDRNGKMDNVVLGFDSLKQYLGGDNALLGAVVGRVANRIANKKFTLDGKEYILMSNIHGGPKGFDKQVWSIEEIPGKEVALKLTYFSKDGEMGYPGNLNVTVIYTLTNNNELKLDYSATTDKATPVVLTNHTYFNLAGNTGIVTNWRLTILADKYLEADKDVMPTGNLLDVKGTPYDFTEPTTIGKNIDATPNGYDLSYALRNKSGEMALAAMAYEPVSGRQMQVYTTEPGLVVYTGNHFSEHIIGRNGLHFNKWGALCLETQHYPDAPNHANFPNVILRPDETFHSETIYKFSVRK
jgi:aldose 1-epimerase